ncbi:hypothetical protein K431DRAFT_292174 [Polychaeton citri CBS 116435]|uniref:SH3 domain-containing protein n=1 Tax=Polychaeton citri CBS 116435 TaxID=1314669 RepID=A0A9P4QFH5_9PEZI|nr:hypothetical protein K431DRAFT_292174 [Polychaeton citri CBS 116435]
MAQSCISLAGSTQCAAFNSSSISTNSNLTSYFPFLSDVTDLASFDSGIQEYIANGFTRQRYEQLIGCDNVNLDNTTAYYARYTTSVLCNAIVQNSITPCDLSGDASRPLCASSCADYAQSEQEIAASDVCSNPSSYALTQIRADFTNCALPSNSLTSSCIDAYANEPDNCGFNNNTGSLCSYCAASSPNATDSCCVFSGTETRCQGVQLPVVASSELQPIVTSTVTLTPSSTSTATPAAAGTAHRGLSGGQIAGIVVGSILGALLLLAVIILACVLFRRRRTRSPATSVFEQPTSQQPQMAYAGTTRDQGQGGITALGGGRVARMAALEGSSGDDNNNNGGGIPYLEGGGYRKSASSLEDSPDSRYGLPPPVRTTKRSGSLSSGSQFAIAGGNLDSSPSSAEYQEDTSPESHGQSEQLGFFKDYYSQDEIHPTDLVSTLWAYEPRAADEFQLERGDMIKVLGIWDDGWATGVRVRQRADDWRTEDKVQRDSGMTSNSSQKTTQIAEEGEVKAFPLVCVCLPQHWRKTIEGEASDTAAGAAEYPDIP